MIHVSYPINDTYLLVWYVHADLDHTRAARRADVFRQGKLCAQCRIHVQVVHTYWIYILVLSMGCYSYTYGIISCKTSTAVLLLLYVPVPCTLASGRRKYISVPTLCDVPAYQYSSLLVHLDIQYEYVRTYRSCKPYHVRITRVLDTWNMLQCFSAVSDDALCDVRTKKCEWSYIHRRAIQAYVWYVRGVLLSVVVSYTRAARTVFPSVIPRYTRFPAGISSILLHTLLCVCCNHRLQHRQHRYVPPGIKVRYLSRCVCILYPRRESRSP